MAKAPISLDPYATSLSLYKGLAYLMVIVSTALLVNRVERVRAMVILFVVSGSFQALYGAAENLFGERESLVFSVILEEAATGSFIYKNHFANYLLLSLCLGIGLIVSQLHSTPSGSWVQRLLRWSKGALSQKMFWRMAIVIMVIALVMSRSRMGNAAFFAATVLGSLVALMFYKDKPRALVVFMLSILFVDSVIIGSLFGFDQVQQEIAETSLATETRDEVVEWSIPMLKDFAVTGVGMGGFGSSFPSYMQRAIGYYNHAHNEYVEFAVEAGIPMTLMLGAICLWSLKKCINVMRTHNSKTLKGTALGCFMAIVGMLLHISVDFNLQPPANALTFLVLLTLTGCLEPVRVQRRLRGATRV
ncbi:O-antigen ligase family protein [Vibrio sp. AK197]